MLISEHIAFELGTGNESRLDCLSSLELRQTSVNQNYGAKNDKGGGAISDERYVITLLARFEALVYDGLGELPFHVNRFEKRHCEGCCGRRKIYLL